MQFFCPKSSFNLRFNKLRLSNLASNIYSRLSTAFNATSHRCDTPFWAAFCLPKRQIGVNNSFWTTHPSGASTTCVGRTILCKSRSLSTNLIICPVASSDSIAPTFDSVDWRTEFEVLPSNTGATKREAKIFRLVSWSYIVKLEIDSENCGKKNQPRCVPRVEWIVWTFFCASFQICANREKDASRECKIEHTASEAPRFLTI